jgi:hypothetical protein
MDAAMTKQINETTPKVRDKIIIKFFFLSIITLGLGMLVLFEVGGEIMEIVEGIFNKATDPVEEESFWNLPYISGSLYLLQLPLVYIAPPQPQSCRQSFSQASIFIITGMAEYGTPPQCIFSK